MKKNVLLYILLGFLMIMNGFFLFNHLGKPNQKRPPNDRPVKFIADRLEFDASQLEQFQDLDLEHREKMRLIVDKIKTSKDALFDKLSDDTMHPSEIDSFASIIADREKAKDLETFRFFREVGRICNKDQKEKLKSIIKDALRRQGPPGRNGPPPGGPRDDRRPPSPSNGH